MKVSIENLNFSYATRRVLNISSVEFEQGKIYGIVGKNGIGKTTFFKAITNIITNYKGSVVIDGVEVKANLGALSKVGVVLDNMELYRNFTGLFNLRYFGGLRGGFDEEQALQYARELDIADALKNKVKTYSLGMQKKLILLISIMNDAEMLIFDEPFRGIDAKSVAWFKAFLLSLKNKGRMILISSHVREDIESMADSVLVMSDGDFKDSFDLKNANQVFVYKLEVSDKALLIGLLKDKHIDFELNGEQVKVDLTEAQYKEIFKEAVARDIEFLQINKESKFVDLLK